MMAESENRKVYLDDPNVEEELFGEQPPTDYVQNPPTHLKIKGVVYRYHAIDRIVKGGPEDGKTLYLVSLLESESLFFLNADTGERTAFKCFGVL